jgi:hypothetical protein
LSNEKKINFSVLSFLIPFVVLSIFLFYNAYFLGLYFEGFGGDYSVQHIPLYEYVRYSFYQTNDFFPQLNMRLGGFSSFASMIYYGSMNPFIWISFLFPNVPMQVYIEFLMIPFISFISYMNFKILRFHNVIDLHNLLISIAFSVSSVILHQYQFQLPFIWFYPFFLISMWSIQKFDDRYIYFIFSFAMVFYFNLQFSIASCFFLFIYMIYLKWTKLLVNKSYLSYFKLFVVVNILSLMIGFLPFIVQGLASNARSLKTSEAIFNINFIDDIFISNYETFGYEWGLYLFAVVGFISLFFIKSSKIYVFIITLVISIFIVPITTALNMFLYYDIKIYIYYIPIMMIVFALTIELLKKKKKLFKFLIFILMNIFIYFICVYKQNPEFQQLALKYILIQDMVIFTILFLHNKYLYIFVSIMTVFFSISSFNSLSSDLLYVPSSCDVDYKLERSLSYDIFNTSTCSEDFLMSGYTSITNENLSYYKTNVLNDNLYPVHALDIMLLRDSLTMQALSISIDEGNVDPFIKGVSNEFIYAEDESTFSNVDMLTHVESETATTIYEDEYNQSLHYEEDFTLNANETTVYNFNDYCNSYFQIRLEIEGPGQVYINDQLFIDSNGIPTANGRIATYNQACNGVNEIEIRAETDVKITDATISFFDYNEIVENSYDISEPTNINVQYNESVTFDLNMETDGMMITTIPYDDGFNVKVDGVEVDTEVVNHYFLGVPLEAGNHTIEITFKMKGFYLGLIVTIIGILITIYLVIKQKKPSF